MERTRVTDNKTSSDKTVEELKQSNTDIDKYIMRDSGVSCWWKWIYDIFLPISEANKKAGWGWTIDTAEYFQFTVYHGDKNEGGFYGWHTDGSSDFINA